MTEINNKLDDLRAELTQSGRDKEAKDREISSLTVTIGDLTSKLQTSEKTNRENINRRKGLLSDQLPELSANEQPNGSSKAEFRNRWRL